MSVRSGAHPIQHCAGVLYAELLPETMRDCLARLAGRDHLGGDQPGPVGNRPLVGPFGVGARDPQLWAQVAGCRSAGCLLE